MSQLRGDLALAQETVGAEDRCQFGAEYFDSDEAVVLQVLGEIDRRHPAPAELPLDRVAPATAALRRGPPAFPTRP